MSHGVGRASAGLLSLGEPWWGWGASLEAEGPPRMMRMCQEDQGPGESQEGKTKVLDMERVFRPRRWAWLPPATLGSYLQV